MGLIHVKLGVRQGAGLATFLFIQTDVAICIQYQSQFQIIDLFLKAGLNII